MVHHPAAGVALAIFESSRFEKIRYAKALSVETTWLFCDSDQLDQCMARVTVLRVGPCPDCCPDDCASAGESGSTQCGVYPPGSNQIFVCCGPFFCPCCSWRKNIVIVYDDEVVGVLGAETIQRESGDEECASRSSAPPPSPPSPPRSFSGANRSEAEAPLPPPDQPDAIASHPTEGPRVRFADEVLEAR